MVPPKESPIAHTKKATGRAPNEPKPTISFESAIAASVKFRMVNTNTKVPTTSPNKLKNGFRIAGAVQKTAFFVFPSFVASK